MDDLVLLHGFTDVPRTWELVRPALERRHRVVAPALPGHLGGPPLPERLTGEALLDAVEDQLDAAGVGVAHLVGNSLGGHLALRLAERGRARSVVALAPAGGWEPGDRSFEATLAHFPQTQALVRAALPRVDALLATERGRRQASQTTTVRWRHLPADLLAEQLQGVAACTAVEPFVAAARAEGWPLRPERITCPVRVVWGAADVLLPWPGAAAGLRRQLPHADWVVLDDVGHAPQLDVPLETAELVLDWTA